MEISEVKHQRKTTPARYGSHWCMVHEYSRWQRVYPISMSAIVSLSEIIQKSRPLSVSIAQPSCNSDGYIFICSRGKWSENLKSQ